MKILALDTATEACSVALLVDGHLVSREMEFERGHAEHILSMVDAVLGEAGLVLNGLDALAFGRGPGGFTGVRLAASVTQGLAFAAELPVVGISNLAAVGQRALDLAPEIDRVIVCNDARMQEVYWACFERDAHGTAAMVGVEHVGAPGTVEVWPHWRTGASATSREQDSSDSPPNRPTASGQLPQRSVVTPRGARAGAIGAAGRGFRAYDALRAKLLSSSTDPAPDHVKLISDTLLPRAHEIAHLAVTEVKAGRLLPADQAMPVYLRDDVARPVPSRN